MPGLHLLSVPIPLSPLQKEKLKVIPMNHIKELVWVLGQFLSVHMLAYDALIYNKKREVFTPALKYLKLPTGEIKKPDCFSNIKSLQISKYGYFW